MPRLPPCCLVVLLACGPGAEPDDDGAVDDSEPAAGHTDPAVDSEPADSDVVDSDGPETDDTEVVPDPWLGGLVDVTGPLEGEGALVPSPGSPDDPMLGGPQPMSISFGDLDEDGAPEAIVGAGVFASAGTLGQAAYRWTGAALEPAPDVVIPPLANAVVGLIDLDGDGHLDLLANHLRTAFAFGRGDGTFEDPVALDADALMRFGTQLAPWDVDGDGWLDLLVAGGCDSVGVLYALRTGPRTFELVADHTEETGAPVSGASVLPVPGPDGTLIFADGSLCDAAEPHPNFYRLVDGGTGLPWLRATEVPVASPSWQTLPWLAGASTTSELMAMGAALADLDADGRQELLMTFSTPWVVAWKRDAQTGWRDVSLDLHLDIPNFQPRPASPWGVVDPDLDRDGDGDLVVSVGDDNTVYALAAGAPVRMSLFRREPGGYVDVAVPAGMDAIGSWHSVVPTDLDDDGDADVGLGGFGSPPRLYRNDLPGGGAVALRLVGTTSNHLGYGATVEVDVPGVGVRSQVLVRQAQLDSVPEPVVFAGLGSAAEATVRVRWPSGFVQVVEHVGPGAHVIREPELIRVEPAERRLPADGASIATVRVVPRRSDGTPDSAATVAVTVDGATLAGPVARDGDAWVARIRAPAAPGRARVRVSVGGVPLAVRPALWFD